MKILVTAGPTHEYIDDVRFIGNASSGRMGIACARAALERGHEVVLILGPTELAPPPEAETVRIVSAADLLAACERHFDACDALIMAAAVADYAPVERIDGKIKRTSDTLTLHLKRNPDVAATLAARKASQLSIGFALEAADAEANALKKMTAKGCDLIVVNAPAAIGADAMAVRILYADGRRLELGETPKLDIARRLIDIIEQERPGG